MILHISKYDSIRQITIRDAEWPAFQELVQRGSNLWPDAPPFIKTFADEVTVGKQQQDYSREKKMKALSPDIGVGQYVKCEDKKSPFYGNCQHCGKHLGKHYFDGMGSVSCNAPSQQYNARINPDDHPGREPGDY